MSKSNHKTTKTTDTIDWIIAPNGVLSIEGARGSKGEPGDERVRALASLVSKIRDIQPELVDGELTAVVYRTQPNAALHLNYLIEKEGWTHADASASVVAAEAARTGSDAFGDEDNVAYSAEVAAASWEGTEKHSTPVPKLFLGDMIQKVLKQVHPDINIEISKVGQRSMSDLIACAVDAVLDAVDGLPASTSSDQFATVHTNAFLEDDSAKKVLASRYIPRDEVLIYHADKRYSWELRNEIVRVGLAGALASFEAKTAAEQEAVFKAQQDLVDDDPLECDGGVTTPQDVQTAVQRVYPGELAKHAVSEGTKAVKMFNGINCVTFKGGKIQYNDHTGRLTAASDVDAVNSAITSSAGLVAPVLEMAHIMHARLGNPPSLTAAIYLAAAMEYLAAELLELAGNETAKSAAGLVSKWIQPRHLQRALRGDQELGRLFSKIIMLDASPVKGGLCGVHEQITAVLQQRIATPEDAATIDEGGKDAEVNECNSGFLVSGTYVVSGDENRGDAGDWLGLKKLMSSNSSWIHACIEDETPLFTTLSGERQAAVLQASRCKAELKAKASKPKPEPKAKGTPNAKRTHGIFLNPTITRDMILALAARAGCLMVGYFSIMHTQGYIKNYLETLIGSVLPIIEHKKRKVVFATDVLAAAAGAVAGDVTHKVVCGTGRVASMYATSAGRNGGGGGGTPSAFAKLAAEYSAKLARGQYADGDGDYENKDLDICNADGFNKAVTNAWAADLDEKDGALLAEDVDDVYDVEKYKGRARHPSGVPYLTKDEIHADPTQLHKDALTYIREMQMSSGPCIPFMPLAAFVREIAQDLKVGLDFEPEAFRVIRAMLEDYLVHLFQDANLIRARSGGTLMHTCPFIGFDAVDTEGDAGRVMGGTQSLAITPSELDMAEYIRRDY